MILRDYQIDIINKVSNSFKSGNRSVIVQSVTGSGKTAIAADMIRRAFEKPTAVIWFICNRVELIKQTSAALSKINLDFGIVSNGFKFDPNKRIYICSIQTLTRRYHTLKKPNLIFWDEAHSVQSETWSRVFNANQQAYHILLTATPCRLDGKGFRAFAKDMINGPDVSWLIENKFLCEYKAFVPSRFDDKGIKKTMGDYNKTQLNEAVNKPSLFGSAVKEYIQRANGLRNLVFCVSIEHSQNVCAEFKSHGIQAAHIDGGTEKIEREKIINDFKNGTIKVLTSVDLVTTGFDVPAIECITFLRPTQSTSLAIQMMGRGLRTHLGKQYCIYLDHANIFLNHGLPDERRTWDLDGIKKTKEKSEPSVKICPQCFAAIKFYPCRECGYILPIVKQELPQSEQGDLKELSKEEIQAARELKKTQLKMEQSGARSLEQLIQLGRSRGYKNDMWAHHVYKSRQSKK